ncbi:MAG: DUF2256 domain-containing protein [Gammaproteobacteria bacterium]|nr:DUF2256 domain-containing protein [Gammaproteobacteria bacterium]
MKKSELPTKTCPVCRRPFAWRRKWRDCWDEVRYCSKRCGGEARRMKRRARRAQNEPAG